MTPLRRAFAGMPLPRAICALGLCLLLAACATTAGDAARSPAVAAPVEEALLGDWYVIARVPWFGERGRVASRLELSPDGEDRISIVRHWRDGFAEPLESDRSAARRETGSGHLWRVRAWRVLPARLRVLEAAADGSWMLLDSPDRHHAWILAREQVVDDPTYLELERRIRGHGVNTDRLRRVPQVPEQEGRLGFEPAASPTPGR